MSQLQITYRLTIVISVSMSRVKAHLKTKLKEESETHEVNEHFYRFLLKEHKKDIKSYKESIKALRNNKRALQADPNSELSPRLKKETIKKMNEIIRKHKRKITLNNIQFSDTTKTYQANREVFENRMDEIKNKLSLSRMICSGRVYKL